MERVPMIGQIVLPGDYSPNRDCVHVAVALTVAPCDLFPGQRVDKDGNPSQNYVGIVDPYLALPVRKGQRFWLCLSPRTVTGLSHLWTHPAFDEPTKTKEESRAPVEFVRMSDEDNDRLTELMTKNSAGTISPGERDELTRLAQKTHAVAIENAWRMGEAEPAATPKVAEVNKQITAALMKDKE